MVSEHTQTSFCSLVPLKHYASPAFTYIPSHCFPLRKRVPPWSWFHSGVLNVPSTPCRVLDPHRLTQGQVPEDYQHTWLHRRWPALCLALSKHASLAFQYSCFWLICVGRCISHLCDYLLLYFPFVHQLSKQVRCLWELCLLTTSAKKDERWKASLRYRQNTQKWWV